MRNPVPPRASRTNTQEYPFDEDDDEYIASTPRSAIRYPIGRPYTFTQGNRRQLVEYPCVWKSTHLPDRSSSRTR